MKLSFSSLDKKSLAGINLILLIWSDEFLLRNALDKILAFHEITSDMKGTSYKEIFVDRSTSIVDIIELCEEIPFFTSKRLIHLKDINNLKADDTRVLKKYLADIPSHSILILSHVEKKKKSSSKMGGANWETPVKNSGGLVVSCSLRPSDIPNWIKERFASNNLKITNKAVETLFARVGTDMVALENEISKLELYAYGEYRITSEMVEKVVSAYPAAQMYMLTDAITEGNFKKAVNLLSEMVRKPDEALPVTGYLFEFVRRMMRLKKMAESGMTTTQIIGKSGEPAFRTKMTLKSAARFTMDELKIFLGLLYRADKALKRNKDARLVLDSLILRMCRRKDTRRKVKSRPNFTLSGMGKPPAIKWKLFEEHLICRSMKKARNKRENWR
ncbi:MAG: DNA polymerase III subunit delta [Candidatus Eremiobacteraeota bacterium]|nr:DNA polymerase III subunit delta [Candidatus Eremiobacteraeota bacterium]